MCGIAGFAGSDPELLDAMLRSIVHRGPDGQGTDSRSALLDRHAATRDRRRRDRRSTALQRRPQSRARVQRRDLQPRRTSARARSAKGRRFVTEPLRHRSDPARLRGMGHATSSTISPACSRSRSPTAKRAELFIARDRLGIKPLYYVDAPAQFAFASELKALFQDASVRRQPEPRRRCAGSYCSACTTTARTRSSTASSACCPGTRCSCVPTAS